MILEFDALGIEEAENIKEALLFFLHVQEEKPQLDLSRVNKIDLSAIQLLLSLKKSFEKENRTLCLVNPTNSLLEAFELCGCSGLLECSHE